MYYSTGMPETFVPFDTWYKPCPFGLRKWLDFVVVIFFKNNEKITSGGLIMYLGEFGFSTNVYVIKITST